MHGRPGDIFEGCRFLAFLIDQKKADLIFCDENQMRVFFSRIYVKLGFRKQAIMLRIDRF